MAYRLSHITHPKAKPGNKIIFIVGPTAVGKSEVAVELAKLINGEIISCDSMQLYKGMEILTSKPPRKLRKKIKHHLLDLVPPGKEFNVSRYRELALAKIKTIINKGRIPVFCGGTGLYISTLVDGIFKAKAVNSALRKDLNRQADKYGSAYLFKKLKKVDAAAAEKIHPNDIRRIVRALEVFQATGKPISELQKNRQGLANDYELKIFCLNLDRGKLYERIEARTEEMFRQGLVSEVRVLLKKKLSKTAGVAIGINELKGYFEGSYDLDEAKRLIKRNTRRYAKRQLTWFRKDKRIEWINIKEKDKPGQIARRLWKKLY